jgi:hypothetical protein
MTPDPVHALRSPSQPFPAQEQRTDDEIEQVKALAAQRFEELTRTQPSGASGVAADAVDVADLRKQILAAVSVIETGLVERETEARAHLAGTRLGRASSYA